MTNRTTSTQNTQVPLKYLEGTRLTLEHYKYLVKERGLANYDEWLVANCESVTQAQAKEYGFTAPSGGIMLKSADNGQWQLKPDEPTVTTKSDGTQRVNKYLSPKGDSYDVMLPQHPEIDNYWTDPEALKERCYKVDGHPCLVITEGDFKAMVLTAEGVPTVAVLGVEMGLTSAKSDPQGKRFLVRTLERFAKAGLGFIFLFDTDCVTNRNVINGQEKLAHQLKSFNVPIYNGTGLWNMDKGKGADDYIINHGFKQFNHEVLSKVEPIADWLIRINQELKAEGINADDELAPRTTKLEAQYTQVKLVVEDKIRFNELTKEIEFNGKPCGFDDFKLELALQFKLELKCSEKDFKAIIVKIAKDNSYHPVRQYLEECHKNHSNTSIFNGLAKHLFGGNNPLHESFLRKSLIAAVARVYQPGCKVDTALILQGEQGVGKSTFFKTLIGNDWFCDDMGSVNDKDQLLKLHQSWGVEWGELEKVFSKADISDIKAFLSTSTDKIRMPYGARTESMPRMSVIFGTTNRNDVFKDVTGTRRSWLITVSKNVPIDWVRENRDVIWGAAVELYKSGEPWYLNREEQKLSDENNKAFSTVSPWLDDVEIALEGKDIVTTDYLLDILRVNWDSHSDVKKKQLEVADIMMSLKWVKCEGIKDSEGKRRRGYKRPVVVTQPEPETVQTDYTTPDSCVDGCVSSNADDTGVYTDTQPTQQNSVNLKNDAVTNEAFEVGDTVKRKSDGEYGEIVGKTSSGKLTVKPKCMKNSRWYLYPYEIVKVDPPCPFD